MSRVHIVIPYRSDKNLGKAYNEIMSFIPEDDWACFLDYDVQLLTHDAGKILENYAGAFPNAGLLTCFTNRIHPAGIVQLLNGKVSENADMRHHIELAKRQQENLYRVTEINRVISGFLMMVKKQTWNEIKFKENMGCLGVDNDFSRRLMEAGKKILRMDGLYVFHQYRLIEGIKNKIHLL